MNDQNPRILLRAVCCALLFMSIVDLSAARPTPPKIVSIQIMGEKRYSEAQIIAASGLKTGQDFDDSTLQSAVQKLGASGAFDDVEYRYKPEGTGTAVELTVKEARKLHSYIFNNFVWLSNREIDDYLHKQVPLFSDSLPESGAVLDDVAGALQQLLANNQITARVEHIQFGSLGSANWVHLFSATGLELKIQSVQFQGSQSMDSAALSREAAPLVGRSYSFVQCQAFRDNTFVPVYREHGYLRVALGEPTTRVLAQNAGSNEYDIEVTFPVMEGPVYKWDSVKWSGNQALTSSELESLIGMKQGEVANGKKIDAGVDQIAQGYGKKGYIEASVQLEPAYDDTTRTISYSATIYEGRQYHMGTLTLAGLPPVVTQQLQSKWRLKPPDIYDSTYLHEFANKQLGPLLAAAQISTSAIDVRTLVNSDQLTVDVSIQTK